MFGRDEASPPAKMPHRPDACLVTPRHTMSLRQLDLNLLRAFDALMLERNVTRAAARLSLTQPAVSGALQRLRDVFGDPLFVRTQRGIAPTHKALELADAVRRILADVEQLLSPTVFDPATAQRTVTLAATDYALKAVVQPLLAALREQAPGIKVAVLSLDEATLVGKMERGELDMALLTPQTTPPELHGLPLFDEHYVCVMRQGHPKAPRKGLSLPAFCKLDHGIVSLQGGGFTGATDEALAAQGRQRRVVVSVPSFTMLLDLVRRTDIVALVPSRLLAGDSEGLHAMPPPLEVPGFTKILAWHARTHHDAGQRWLRALIVRVCNPLGLGAQRSRA